MGGGLAMDEREGAGGKGESGGAGDGQKGNVYDSLSSPSVRKEWGL